jgi:hypothetical protein
VYMFQLFCNFVNVFPAEIHFLSQKHLSKSVFTNYQSHFTFPTSGNDQKVLGLIDDPFFSANFFIILLTLGIFTFKICWFINRHLLHCQLNETKLSGNFLLLGLFSKC